MFLHVTLYRRKYPLHKYAVVILVTLGVATFTLYAPSLAGKAAKHSAKNAAGANKIYGLFLLSLNLLFDGLTNTIQDDITARFKPYGAAQMMCALNILMTALTSTFLLLSPHLALTSLGQTLNLGTGNELADALAFVKAYPQVGTDVIAFGLCGALGQVAIYHTLSNFGSLLLVTVTVTRKMFTMMLSIAWFGHKITGMQYAGVGMVFGGIGAEAVLKIRQTKEKERVAKARMLSEAGQDHGLRKKDK
jgi:UDP-galactose transporter B1